MDFCENKCVESVPNRTIFDNIKETEDVLTEAERYLDDIVSFIWLSENSVNANPSIEIKDMDSNIVSNLERARSIRDKIVGIHKRLGCCYTLKGE